MYQGKIIKTYKHKAPPQMMHLTFNFYNFSSFCLVASSSIFLRNSSSEESKFDERSIGAGKIRLPRRLEILRGSYPMIFL